MSARDSVLLWIMQGRQRNSLVVGKWKQSGQLPSPGDGSGPTSQVFWYRRGAVWQWEAPPEGRCFFSAQELLGREPCDWGYWQVSTRDSSGCSASHLEDIHLGNSSPPWENPTASPVPQTVENLSLMQETQVQSLDQEDPLEEDMAIHSHILAWRIPWTEEPGGLYSPWGCKELDTTE